MKEGKIASLVVIGEAETLLEQLFPSSNSNQLVDFNVADLATFGQLVSYACALGGLVTFYGRPAEQCIGVSVRLDKLKRSLSYSGDDLDTTIIVQFVNGLKVVYLKRLDGPIAPSEATRPLKARRKG